MMYLMFVCVDETTQIPADADLDPTQWVDSNGASGRRVLGDRIRPQSDAKTVRVRGGKTVVTDGPYVETKEYIAGFDVLECESLEEALEVAAAHPMARYGAVEVRAAWPWEG